MAEAQQRGLTAHYFLNFSVVPDRAPAGHSGSWRRLVHLQQPPHTVLHVDLANGSVSTVDHEKETVVAQVADVLEVCSLPGASMHLALSLRDGRSPGYRFQTNHDAIVFQTTLLQTNHDAIVFQTALLQLMHAAVPLGALPYPRQLLKRGALQKRGRSGVFHDRFVVLVPARMFIMRSREAKYPLNVLSLVSTKPAFDGTTRAITLTVGDKTFVMRGVTDDDAADWLRKIEGSIGLRYNPYKYSQQAVAAAAAQPPPAPAVSAAPTAARQPAAASYVMPIPRQNTVFASRPAGQQVQIAAADGNAAFQDAGAAPPSAGYDRQDADRDRDNQDRDMAGWREVAAAARYGEENYEKGDAPQQEAGNGYRDSDGTTFEDSREFAASADGSLSVFEPPTEPGKTRATTTETLGTSDLVNDYRTSTAEDEEKWNNDAAGDDATPRQAPRLTSGEAAPAMPLQQHIGAVLSRVRSVMSGVDSLKQQQAALAAVGSENLAQNSLQEGLIPAGRSEGLDAAADAAAARAFLQRWQSQQDRESGLLSNGVGGGSPAAPAAPQAVRVQALLQELASLSADGGNADGRASDEPGAQQLRISLGDSVNLRLLPNMRIVLEMDGGISGGIVANGGSSWQQPLMTPEACAHVAEAAITAARAAKAAVAIAVQ